MPVEVNIGILLLDVIEKLTLLLIFVVVGFNGTSPLLNLHNFKRLSLHLLGRLVDGSVTITSQFWVIRILEEFFHVLSHWIVQVIDHVFELAFSFKILDRGALFPLEVTIIKIIIQCALHVLGYVLHFLHICAWLIISHIKTRVKFMNNGIDNVSWMLQSLCQARVHIVRVLEH